MTYRKNNYVPSYLSSYTMKGTSKLPQLGNRLPSADRDSEIKNLQQRMAYTMFEKPTQQNDIQVEKIEGIDVQKPSLKKKFQFDYTSIIGRRMTQEDSELIYFGNRFTIAGVFDGHGGAETSRFCSANFVDYFMKEVETGQNIKNALHATCLRLDSVFCKLNSPTVGCTLTVVVFDSQQNQYFIANVGDSKSLIGTPTSIVQTIDHKPSSQPEQQRIKRHFPNTRIITMMGIARVDGQLSLSRAIGDEYMKMSGIIPDPETYEYQGDVEYVLIACDGLFDVFSVNEIDDLVRTMKYGKRVNKNGTRLPLLDAALAYFKGHIPEADKILGGIAGQRIYKTNACEEVNMGSNASKRISQILTKMAYWKNSMDNITVIVGLLE